MEEIQKQKIKRTKIEIVIIFLLSLLAIYLILDGVSMLIVDLVSQNLNLFISIYFQMSVEQKILVMLDHIYPLLMVMTGFIIMIALDIEKIIKKL